MLLHKFKEKSGILSLIRKKSREMKEVAYTCRYTSEYLIPNSVKLVCLFFCNVTMTGEPMHTASKERMAPELMFSSECASQISNTESAVAITFTFSYVQPVTHRYRRKTVEEVPLQQSSIDILTPGTWG